MVGLAHLLILLGLLPLHAEVDQLEVEGCADSCVSEESLMHDDDSKGFLTVRDVALPLGPRDFGSQCCFVYPTKVPSTFPDVFSLHQLL